MRWLILNCFITKGTLGFLCLGGVRIKIEILGLQYFGILLLLEGEFVLLEGEFAVGDSQVSGIGN